MDSQQEKTKRLPPMVFTMNVCLLMGNNVFLSLIHILAAQIEQPCHEVDHIPLGSAAKAEEIFLVQLQARIPVVVERAASHAVAIDFQPVVFGGLLYACLLYTSSLAIGKSAEASCPAFSRPSSRLIFSHCSFIFAMVSAGTFSASQAKMCIRDRIDFL